MRKSMKDKFSIIFSIFCSLYSKTFWFHYRKIVKHDKSVRDYNKEKSLQLIYRSTSKLSSPLLSSVVSKSSDKELESSIVFDLFVVDEWIKLELSSSSKISWPSPSPDVDNPLFDCIRLSFKPSSRILFLVEKSLGKKLSACLLVCPQGQKNIDFYRWLVLTIHGRNTLGTWVIDVGKSESEVSLIDLIKLN